MHTEDEARRLWCPHALGSFRVESARDIPPPAIVSVNRDRFGVALHPCTCLASHCMMWRWAMVPGRMAGDPGSQATGIRTFNEPPAPTLIRTSHGYCGLAGKS